jgi:hypothetical protein
MNAGGWNQLRCSYFQATCVSQIGSFLQPYGFVVSKSDADVIVIFRRLEVYIEIGYLLEFYPDYVLTVVIGLGDGRLDAVPLWYVIPQNDSSNSYSLWTFSSEVMLRSVLIKIQNEVILPYAQPLWQDIEQLRQIVTKFNRDAADRRNS